MKNNKKIFNFFIFFFVFYLVMALGSFVQILLYQKNNDLINFGYSYAAMAIAGAFTQYLFQYVSYVKDKLVIILSFFMYAVAIYLRIFTSSLFLSVCSGFIGGIGATIIIVYIRIYLMHLAEGSSKNEHAIISSRYSIMQLATLIGTGISGILISAAAHYGISMTYLTKIISIIMLLLVFWPKDMDVQLHSERRLKIFTSNSLLLRVLCSSLLLGLLVSTFDPLIPAFFSNLVQNVNYTSLLTTLAGGLTLIGSIILANKRYSDRPISIITIIMLLIGILFLITFGLRNNNMYIFSIGGYALLVGAYMQLKEVYEYDLQKKEDIDKANLIAISQTSFLIGDSIGTPIMSFVFQNGGYTMVLLSYGVLV